jgi:hypothetical protein
LLLLAFSAAYMYLTDNTIRETYLADKLARAAYAWQMTLSGETYLADNIDTSFSFLAANIGKSCIYMADNTAKACLYLADNTVKSWIYLADDTVKNLIYLADDLSRT